MSMFSFWFNYLPAGYNIETMSALHLTTVSESNKMFGLLCDIVQRLMVNMLYINTFILNWTKKKKY